MYDVGCDRITVLDDQPAPMGLAHAVDRDGEVICRAERPRYHFPWLDWMGEQTPDEARATACPECATIALERALPAGAAYDPYPAAAATSATSAEEVPTQPTVDWLRDPADFTAWSIGL